MRGGLGGLLQAHPLAIESPTPKLGPSPLLPEEPVYLKYLYQ